MEAKRCRCEDVESKYSWKAYVAMISLQFGFAGMILVTKVSFERQPDVSPFVLVVYRQAIATLLLTPLALFFERKKMPTITFPIFMHMFFLALLGPVMEQNLYYLGLKLSSSTFTCAITNLLPALTFFIALLSKMEKTKKTWKAKVSGITLTISGALLITTLTKNTQSLLSIVYLISSTLTCASFITLLAITAKKYKAPLTLTVVVCGLGTLQSTAVALVMESDPSVWNVGFGINLFAAGYAGVVATGIGYYVQAVVAEMAGPVFVSAFNPLITIVVAIISSFILDIRQIYLAGIMGATLMIIGVCSLLWGKHKDIVNKEEVEGNHDQIQIKEVIRVISHSCSLPTIFEEDDIEANTPVVSVQIEMPSTVESDKDVRTKIVIVPVECRSLAHGSTK